jgi:hypothetical protein
LQRIQKGEEIMKKRLYSLMAAFGFCLAAILLFGTFVSLAAPQQDSVGSVDHTPVYLNDGATTIAARMAISIPTVFLFGFTEPDSDERGQFGLSDDGRTLYANGHAECDGEHFRLMVTITQEATGARAMGRTVEKCDGEGKPQTWNATARALGPAWRTFESGEAHACAMAIIHPARGGAVVKWCADVDIVER